MPPPLPLSAALPMIRLALITRPGPVPSLGADRVRAQARSPVGRRAAGRIGVRGAHDQEAAAVGRNRRVGALVEQDRVVLDVAVVAEPEVTDAAAVTGAQVAAHPVVVELVVVGAGAEADAARARRRGREQLVAGRGVQRDVVVVHVHVQVEAVRQLRLAGRPCWSGRSPGAALVALPCSVRSGGNSPWPTLMPPDSVPALL